MTIFALLRRRLEIIWSLFLRERSPNLQPSWLRSGDPKTNRLIIKRFGGNV
jgi:hypothetical protein